MISKFEFDLDLGKEMNAIVLEDSDLTKKESELKVYIPLIMANIKQETPKTSILPTKGLNIFKCNKKPKITSIILKERNYMETDMNTNDNVNDMISTVSIISKTPKKLNYTIKKNSSVRVKFLNSKISKLSYSTTAESTTSKTAENLYDE